MVRAEGVAALSLRALARTVGMEPQSMYSYFASKHAIYDAMFAEANAEFLTRLEAVTEPEEPFEAMRMQARQFVDFCTEDPARYQLLYQRTIPGFEPSEASYAIARRVLAHAQASLARAGITQAAQLDLYTAITTGLVAQQLANDPGGQRWLGLLDEALSMYFNHINR